MNYKGLVLIIAVLVLLNALALYLIKGNQTSKTPLLNNQSSSPKTLSLPTDPSESGVDHIRVVYTFTGTITEIKSEGQNLNIKLDANSPDFPQFKTTPRTIVISTTGGGKPEQRALSDVKLGENVILSDSYDTKANAWELQVINIVR